MSRTPWESLLRCGVFFRNIPGLDTHGQPRAFKQRWDCTNVLLGRCFHLTHHTPAGVASQSPALLKASPSPVPGGVAALHAISPAPKMTSGCPQFSHHMRADRRICYLARSSSLLNVKVSHKRTEGKGPGVIWVESHPPVSGRVRWPLGSYPGAGRGGPPQEIWPLRGPLPTWGP